MIWTATSRATKAAAGQAALHRLFGDWHVPECEAQLRTFGIEFEIRAMDDEVQQPVRENDGAYGDGGACRKAKDRFRQQRGGERPGDCGG